MLYLDWCKNMQFARNSSILLFVCILLQLPSITYGTNGLCFLFLTLFLTHPLLPRFLSLAGLAAVVLPLMWPGSRSAANYSYR